MKYDFWIWENKLSKSFCDLILSEVDWKANETASIVESKTDTGLEIHRIDKSIRDTNIVWHDSTSIMGCIISAHIHSANEQAGWNMSLDYMEGVQMGKYGIGGKYDWHADVPMGEFLEEENPRKLSCSILLNDTSEFKGGEFKFKNENLNLNFGQGSILVFPSFLEHRVTPVTEGTRYTAVSWMHGGKVKL
jgi:PKHD-type hydroxylase